MQPVANSNSRPNLMLTSSPSVTSFLPNGNTGTVLTNSGTGPQWSNPGGFVASFGGNVTGPTGYLAYGLPYTLFANTSLTTTTNIQNYFVMPTQGILAGASCYNSTGAASATMTVHVNGGTVPVATAAAGQFSATGPRSLTISPTTTLVTAGSYVEVRINIAQTNNTMVNLYFA